MKKFIALFLVLLLSATSVAAATYTSDLPSGKNYLDPNNFRYFNGELGVIDPFKVIPNQDYTLSIPREVDTTNLYIFGDDDILDGNPADFPECSDLIDKLVCTFTTSSEDNYLYIFLDGRDLEQYYQDNGMYLFQLEEGTSSTEYNGYIPPNDTTPPSIVGNGTYITTYRDTTAIETIVSNHITAVDEKDGDVSSSLVVYEDNYTNNRTVIGEYLVIVQASDTLDNTSQFNLTIVVQDNYKPVIVGNNIVTTNINNPSSLQSILQNYSAVDQYDGEIEITIEEDDYTENIDTIGAHEVIISATDSSNNQETRIINIITEDTTGPTVTSDVNINTIISAPLSIDSIINSLTITDNYDNENDVIVEVVSDQYTDNMLKKGVYEVEIVLKDLSDNTALETLYITVNDDILPEISGPNSVYISYEESKTEAYLRSLFSVSDNETELTIDDLIITTNEYITHESELGDYKLTFAISDQSGNTTTRTLNITVVDDVPPMIYVDDFVVTVAQNAKFTNYDLIRMLVRNNELENEDYEVEVLVDDYTKNKNTPGVYNYQVNILSNDGKSIQKNLMIKVTETENSILESPDNLKIARNIAAYASVIGMITIVVFKLKRK